ncbi:hypothetical protein [Noviherbaspirillum saxi]|uniref:Uncharacterized protein n=1 Tax=Noviherbaspirillum saxi TaxID=2320863 RepID=A0A3A3FU23_9BURK|nr:hypothetical protein [Noviherbaspirillum saxi]RJF99040.1 hypothetical protein D3871_11350 [Noviherbaspirillum saxi]
MSNTYINFNTTLAELINIIELDPNATTRERALIERMDGRKDEVEEKEAEIDRLEGRVSELEKEVNEMEDDMSTLETERDALKDTVNELECELEQLKTAQSEA